MHFSKFVVDWLQNKLTIDEREVLTFVDSRQGNQYLYMGRCNSQVGPYVLAIKRRTALVLINYTISYMYNSRFILYNRIS